MHVYMFIYMQTLQHKYQFRVQATVNIQLNQSQHVRRQNRHATIGNYDCSENSALFGKAQHIQHTVRTGDSTIVILRSDTVFIL